MFDNEAMRASLHPAIASALTTSFGLPQVVAAALPRTAGEVPPGQVDAQSANVAFAPRDATQGAITGRTGTADVILEGRHLTAAASLAGRTTGLSAAGVARGLSPARRALAKSCVGAVSAFLERVAQAAGDTLPVPPGHATATMRGTVELLP